MALMYELSRYDLALLKANASTSAKEAAASVTVNVYRQGAWTQGTGSDTGAGSTITVHDPGMIRASDTVQIGTDSSVTRTVSSITATTIVLNSGGAGTFSWVDGDRIVPTNARPLTYTDDAAGEATSSASQVTTDSAGEASFYSRASTVDMISDDGQSNLSLIADQAGIGGRSSYSPFEWGAVVDGDGAGGGTDDATALVAQVAYLKAKGGGVLELPPGNIELGSTITFSAVSNLTIKGAGRGVTIVDINHTGTGFDFTSTCSDVTISGITFRRITGTADHIQIGSSCNRVSISDALFIGGGTGIDDDGTDTRIRDVWFTTGTWTSFVTLTGTRPHVTSLVGRPTANWTRGIDVDTGAVNVRLLDVDIASNGSTTGTGIHIRDTDPYTEGSSPPKDVTIANVHIANQAKGTGTCVQIADCVGVQFIGGLLENADIGLDMDGGKSVKFIGTNFVNIDLGIDWDGGSHLRLVECDLSDVGGTPGEGISIAAGLDDFSILGCVGGDHWNASGIFPSPMVSIAAGVSDRVQVLAARDDVNTGGIISSSSTSLFMDVAHSMTYSYGSDHGSVLAWPNLGIGSQYLNGAETTIDPKGTSFVLFDHATGATITSMGTGQTGQILFMLNIGAGNQIIQAGTTIKTPSAGNITLATNDTALWIYQGTAWRLIAEATNT